jgi:hypothetical protein
MIRLVVTLVACLLLQPTETSAGQRRERTAAAAAATTSDGAAIAPSPGGLDAPLAALTAWRPALDGPPWQATAVTRPSSAQQVFRLWLVSQRLLC